MSIIRTIEGQALNFSPPNQNNSAGGGRLGVDPAGNLAVRGPVHTDEGGYRTNFTGSTFYNDLGSGFTFTNNNKVVTSTTSFDLLTIRVGDYIKLASDPDSNYTKVASIDTSNQLTLEVEYPGSSSTGNAYFSSLFPKLGTGASFSVSQGKLTITAGTANSTTTELERDVDYLPLVKQSILSVSQRLVGQDIYIGLYDINHDVTPYYYAWFRLTGTDKEQIITETAGNKSSAPTSFEIESNSISLPATLSTDQLLRYRIEVEPDRVRFLINGNLVSEHFNFIPNQYVSLESTIKIVNGATDLGINNIITVVADGVMNINKLNVGLINNQDPIPAEKTDMENMTYLLSEILGKLPLLNASGQVRVSLDASTATVTVTATNLQSNVAQFGGTNISTGTGVGGTGIPRITQSADALYLGAGSPLSTNLNILYDKIVTS